MVRCTAIGRAALLLTAAIPAASGALWLELGGAVVVDNTDFEVTYYDSAGGVFATEVFDDGYNGLAGELLLRSVPWLTARLVLAEARLLRTGGISIVVLPSPGLDLLLTPPVRWRVVPYAWAGFSAAFFQGNPGRFDPRFYDSPEMNLRAGMGARWHATSQLSVFAEAGAFSHSSYLEVNPASGHAGYWRHGVVGLTAVRVGVRRGWQ